MNRKKKTGVTVPDEVAVAASYAVPGEVAVALNTGRSQFINGLVNKVRKGHVVEPVQVIGMLELIRDWTDAKYADDRRNTILKEDLAVAKADMRDLRMQVIERTNRLEGTIGVAAHVADRHGSGPLGPEDDIE